MTGYNRTIIGDATLYLGDCADHLEFLGDDLTGIMDPPYLFNASGGGKMRAARKGLDEIQANKLDKGFDISLITAKQFRTVALFCHNDQIDLVTAHLKAEYGRFVVGFWGKTNPIPVRNKNFLPDAELYVWAWRNNAEFLSEGYPVGLHHDMSRFWIGQNGRQDDFDHPTVKPVPLMRKMVRNAQGDTIVDLFMGTGATAAGALIEGRKFIGIEKNPVYFDMAVKRITALYRDRLTKFRLNADRGAA